jgi:hypothetical protein
VGTERTGDLAPSDRLTGAAAARPLTAAGR